MAGLLWYRSYMESLANTSGYYPNIHAGHADRVAELTLDAPYLVRETPAGYSKLELSSIIGGSVAWNQLAEVYTGTRSGVTVTDGGQGDADLSGTISTTYLATFKSINLVAGHKYVISRTTLANPNNVRFKVGAYNAESVFSLETDGMAIVTTATSRLTSVGLTNLTANTLMTGIKVRYQIIDLTAMLPSDIADYVYSLEQATAGSGIAWLKSYDYLKEDYYAYSAPALEHVKTTAHITKDADDNVLGTYPFDSSLLLRGVPKLENGALIYDGDTYEPDGTVTRYFGIRAYQAGDESLTDAITDGTDTVYKLGAPTTESADPYTAVQDVAEGGTEEFVTGNNVPVGNVSVYRRA